MKHLYGGRSVSALAMWMVAAVFGAAWAQDKPATATSPASQPANETVVEGILAPVDPFELKLKLKTYAGAMPIARIAAQYAAVQPGDVLLEIDPTEFKRALATVTAAADAARVALKKAEVEDAVGAKADAMALRQQQDALKQAEANVGYWDKIDGPHFLQQLELGLKQWRYSVEDQEDELEQLRKMYKSEELTSATADIVVKRAIRRLEQTKISQKMHEDKTQRSREQEYPNARQRVVDALEQTRNQLTTLVATQEQAVVTRRNAVISARIALEQAEEKLRDIQEDQKLLLVKSPIGGMVVYGTTGDGGWQGGDPRALKPGEKLASGASVLRVIVPGRMRLEGVLKDDVGFKVQEGMKARVKVTTLPGIVYEGVCGAPVILPKGSAGVPSFALTVKLPELDKRLLPGMKATANVALGDK